MADMKVDVNWKGNLQFDAHTESGHTVTMDTSKENGGDDQGATPMEMLLNGVAGCTGIDVVLILEKMNQELDDLKIEIEGNRADDYPQRYTDIHLKFTLKGNNLDPKKVERAIDLSEGKYCSASNSLNAEITTEYEIVE